MNYEERLKKEQLLLQQLQKKYWDRVMFDKFVYENLNPGLQLGDSNMYNSPDWSRILHPQPNILTHMIVRKQKIKNKMELVKIRIEYLEQKIKEHEELSIGVDEFIRKHNNIFANIYSRKDGEV